MMLRRYLFLYPIFGKNPDHAEDKPQDHSG